jgi:hypothetical protein
MLHRTHGAAALARGYPNYGAALAAATGEQFITLVSRTWSTDPDRAGKVLDVYDHHRLAFEPAGRELATAPPGSPSSEAAG